MTNQPSEILSLYTAPSLEILRGDFSFRFVRHPRCPVGGVRI